jgi:hypothetical protein
MALITKNGRELNRQLYTAGLGLNPWLDRDKVVDLSITLSLIARHAKTYRRLAEIQCGDGIHSGEWVNTHYEWLEKREAQVAFRLWNLAQQLPNNVRMELQGDPRGYLVRLIVTDETGIERTVGVD